MIDLDVETDSSGSLCAKFSSDTWEANVRASAHDFLALAGIREADWNSRASLPVGTCAGAPVFWSHERGVVSILIGNDDETWDVALTVPIALVDELVRIAGTVAAPT